MSGNFDAQSFDGSLGGFDVEPYVLTGLGGGGGRGGIYYGRGGKKRRNKTYEMFTSIEATLREAMATPVPDVAIQPSRAKAQTIGVALKHLTETAEGYQDLQFRLAEIRAEVAAYQRRLLDEDDDEMMMMH